MMIGNWQKNKAGISFFVLVIFFILCVGAASCNLKKQQSDPGISFTKIYDKSDGYSYTAVDIKQLSDGGYIVLGMVDRTPYLLRLDGQGSVMWDTDTETFAGYKDPVPDIFIFDRAYYFFCNEIDYEDGEYKPVTLLKFSKTTDTQTFVPLSTETLKYNLYIMPMDAAATPDGKILLLGIDEYNDKAFLLKLNVDGSSIWEKTIAFDYVCAYDYPLFDKRYHFTGGIGNSGNDYYNFQSYINEDDLESYANCFTTRLVDSGNGEIIEEDFVDEPSIAKEWDGIYSSGALSRNDIIYFYVNYSMANEVKEYQHEELIPSKQVFIKTTNVQQKQVIFFAGSAKNNKIILYAYDKLTGGLLGKKYFGHTHLYEAAGLTSTEDIGLALLCTTYVAGRLGRICLFKFSKEDLATITNQR